MQETIVVEVLLTDNDVIYANAITFNRVIF